MQPVQNQAPPAYPAILNLGFRPFFAAAALFSVFTVLAWAGMYLAGWDLQSMALPPSTWHAHEMIFGYGQAVIAGFLLTAVGNWTGKQMLHGYPLLALLLLWLAARLLFLAGEHVSTALLAGVDCAFTVFLIIALLRPILEAGQMKQLGIISKLVLMLASNLLFYAGMLGLLDDGMRIGLYSGIYLVVALVFVLARRVFPFFIERGVGYAVELRNRTWLDMSSLVLFLAFWVADVLRPDSLPVALLALALLALHALRLAGWHTAGIWQKPLLWVLYLGYLWLVIAFALKAA
ncbi:MAG: NnrS family protein, partial [Gammaproteobacteria bacterium]|nr:NnrS family protein [Gammaproteobacteria bacterium]